MSKATKYEFEATYQPGSQFYTVSVEKENIFEFEYCRACHNEGIIRVNVGNDERAEVPCPKCAGKTNGKEAYILKYELKVHTLNGYLTTKDGVFIQSSEQNKLFGSYKKYGGNISGIELSKFENMIGNTGNIEDYYEDLNRVRGCRDIKAVAKVKAPLVELINEANEKEQMKKRELLQSEESKAQEEIINIPAAIKTISKYWHRLSSGQQNFIASLLNNDKDIYEAK